MHKSVLGPEHPHTLNSMMNLARAYLGQEKYKEAEKLQMEILAIQPTLQIEKEKMTGDESIIQLIYVAESNFCA